MKYLEMKRLQNPENKMQPGSRPDQQDPHILRRSGPDAPKIRPEVQKVADELGVSLDGLQGTGRHGEVTVRDVRSHKAKADAAAAAAGAETKTETGTEEK